VAHPLVRPLGPAGGRPAGCGARTGAGRRVPPCPGEPRRRAAV